MSARHGVHLRGIGTAIPPTVITNDAVSTLVDTSDEWITTRTGFKERRVVSGDELMTDLGIAATQNALAYAGMAGHEIDLIIFGSSTPDYIYPAGCGVVQQAIGATRAFGFDLAMGCSGLIYGLGIAIQFVENGTAQNVLVVGSDTHSRYTDWSDRNTCVLFGDGAGALIVSRAKSAADTDLLALDMMLDGSKGQEIRLPINRDNCPLVAPRTRVEKSAIYMNGREVFKFAVTEVPRQIERALDKAHLSPQEIDYYVLHQANARIMTSLVERMAVSPEKMIVHVEKYGNTSAASIALALMDAVDAGTIRSGHTLLLCGFGAGLAVATAVVKWRCVDHRPADTKSQHAGRSLETGCAINH